MPFKLGNNLGGRRKEGEGIQEYLKYIASGAAREYYRNVEKQFAGEELPKPVKEAMDRFERNTEFVTPKLARTESRSKVDINSTVKQINYLKPNGDNA